MSYSEMNRATYKICSTSIRANGNYHGLKWIECSLEREDMRRLLNQAPDLLARRAEYKKLETPRNAFMLTTPFKASESLAPGA